MLKSQLHSPFWIQQASWKFWLGSPSVPQDWGLSQAVVIGDSRKNEGPMGIRSRCRGLPDLVEVEPYNTSVQIALDSRIHTAKRLVR